MKHAIGVHMLFLSISLGSMQDTKNLKKKPFRKNQETCTPQAILRPPGWEVPNPGLSY